jgi:hypothetical protein
MNEQTLRRLTLERIHLLRPRELEESPAHVRQCYSTLWAPLSELARRLQTLPSGLQSVWLDSPGGHVVITHLRSRYAPGEYALNTNILVNVALVSVADLAMDSFDALLPITSLLDHLLGNDGSKEGCWLSEGGGRNAALQGVGRRITALFPLGHGFDALARADVRAYFARSLALYLHDRSALNVADPLLEKLVRTTLMSDRFWA